ncbi:hypothetical protein QKT26_gp91 [Carcinus maenas nudivirus]|uniref:Uncharacterized protein n=1 Tax=Carcinus maenas nudivirus TaxID=2880837 RepID=A0AAE8Y0W4_9VIRU|nr:hypothetical protein QKT26_gp91 [Carcinus maenas nudivirus]UBZ25681.1 hypothetical protein CmNV_090 [Carcinus maenas nudivirus]
MIIFPCFHDSRYYATNVSSCKIAIDSEGIKYHVIHLREPIFMDNMPKLESITYHTTKYNSIDELWEKVSLIPTTSLYSIDKLSDLSLILKVCGQFINTICLMTQQNLFYENLPKANNCTTFLQTTTAIAYDEDSSTPRFINLNRFQIKNANLMPPVQKKRKLLNQVTTLPIIIQFLFFSKSTKKSNNKTIIKCSDTCKLSFYTARFIHFNESPISDAFHHIYCNNYRAKIHIFENLETLFPNEAQAIIDTMKHFNTL